MRRYALACLFAIGLLFASGLCLAEPEFPRLSGRVVDSASLLSGSVRDELTRLLDEHERETTNQIVVVTIRSLQGYAIEDFGYQLGRHWGIGQADKNNGALLIVAPNERRVRIEVGYGLEGALTDALSHEIIQAHVLPAFRTKDYEQGIVDGTKAILAAIAGTYEAPPKEASEQGIPLLPLLVGILLILVLFHFVTLATPTTGYRRSDDDWGGGYVSSGNGFSSGGFGGGFGGGGGSFGGGGASGSW